MKKIKLFETLGVISFLVMLTASIIIAGNLDSENTVPSYAYVIFGLSLVASALSIEYSNLLKERRAIDIRVKRRREMIKQQLRDEIDNMDDECDMSDICKIYEFKKRGGDRNV